MFTSISFLYILGRIYKVHENNWNLISTYPQIIFGGFHNSKGSIASSLPSSCWPVMHNVIQLHNIDQTRMSHAIRSSVFLVSTCNCTCSNCYQWREEPRSLVITWYYKNSSSTRCTTNSLVPRIIMFLLPACEKEPGYKLRLYTVILWCLSLSTVTNGENYLKSRVSE